MSNQRFPSPPDGRGRSLYGGLTQEQQDQEFFDTFGIPGSERASPSASVLVADRSSMSHSGSARMTPPTAPPDQPSPSVSGPAARGTSPRPPGVGSTPHAHASMPRPVTGVSTIASVFNSIATASVSPVARSPPLPPRPLKGRDLLDGELSKNFRTNPASPSPRTTRAASSKLSMTALPGAAGPALRPPQVGHTASTAGKASKDKQQQQRYIPTSAPKTEHRPSVSPPPQAKRPALRSSSKSDSQTGGQTTSPASTRSSRIVILKVTKLPQGSDKGKNAPAVKTGPTHEAKNTAQNKARMAPSSATPARTSAVAGTPGTSSTDLLRPHRLPRQASHGKTYQIPPPPQLKANARTAAARRARNAQRAETK